MKTSLSTRRISTYNLKRRPFRTVCLIIVVAVLAFTLFGGSIMTISLQSGMKSMEQRLGADLMVVPKGQAVKTEGILLKGEPTYFYFSGSVAKEIAQVKGVSQVSSQFFLASLAASCCAVPVQLIGYDPATDFVVQPWIAKTYPSVLGDGQLIVGSNIVEASDHTIKFFNRIFPIAAKLEKTATGLDNSVFMNMNTMQNMVAAAKERNLKFISSGEPEGSISAVLIKIDKNANADTVAHAISAAVSDADIEIVKPQAIIQGVSNNLGSLVVYIQTLSAIFWILAVVILAVVFSVTINERKKEFAVFRILGATRKKLVGLVLTESFYVSAAGGVLGTALASIVVFPFSTYIGEKLQLPYLQPPVDVILVALVLSLLLSFAVGPLASIYSAVKISKAETYITMREGE
ncbi:MAG: ABC transporter permease [Eubacteriales bacterium]